VPYMRQVVTLGEAVCRLSVIREPVLRHALRGSNRRRPEPIRGGQALFPAGEGSSP
jgi:hypothetical protein